MAEPGFNDRSSLAFNPAKAVGEWFRQAEQKQIEDRRQAILDNTIQKGTKVFYQGHEWTVTRVRMWVYQSGKVEGDGFIDLQRVISGDAVAIRDRVDPQKVKVV